MIVGIGVDIVEIKRIRRALKSAALEKRVFTAAEREYCARFKAPEIHFAGRFAAKEATLKALGTGWSGGIRWTDVETLSDEAGRPFLKLEGRAKEICEKLEATRSWITITHSDDHAVAVAILERG